MEWAVGAPAEASLTHCGWFARRVSFMRFPAGWEGMRDRGFSSSLLIIYIDAQALTELAFRKSGGAATCALVSAGSATERAAFRIPTKTSSSSPLAL